MPEPHSSTAAGIYAGAAMGLTGTILGAQVDAVIVGLVAAISMSIWLPQVDDKLKAFASVAMSSLLAGYGSPVAVPLIMSTVPAAAPAADHMRLLAAVLIGALCPSMIPFGVKWLQQFAGRAGGAQ
ncbi:MAG: hypothetical protein PHY45_02395 [Rhodocyclaceae bacterium]|nr:hypothetical protein [Rhodocyclaceae bacterium]